MGDWTLRGAAPVLAVDGVHGRGWLQAADVIVGQHGSRRSARHWLGVVRHQYPGCVVAVARHAAGRWCFVDLPGHRFLLRGRGFGACTASELGRFAYVRWITCQLAADPRVGRQGA